MPRWPIDKTISLLAWIDFCKQKTRKCKESVLDFVVTSDDVSNRAAVKKHLTDLWRNYSAPHKDDLMPLMEILKHGSACMPNLPPDLLRGIQDRVKKHMDGSDSQKEREGFLSENGQDQLYEDGSATPTSTEKGVKRSTNFDRTRVDTPPSKRARTLENEEPDAYISVESAKEGELRGAIPSSVSRSKEVVNIGQIITRRASRAIADPSTEIDWADRLNLTEERHQQQIKLMQSLANGSRGS